MKQLTTILLCVFFVQITLSQTINFPDANFKAKLVSQSQPTIDTNNDGEISVSEAAAVTGRLKMRGYGGSTGRISDLTGIEFFVNATILEAEDNELTTVDLSNNVALVNVNLNSNNLTAVDFSNNTALEVIDVGSNNLASLDVSSNVNLRILSCTNMQMTALNVNNCTQLEELNCAINQFTTLDLSSNTALKTMVAHSLSQLTNLDLSNNVLLETINCGSGGFSTLDVSNNTALTELRCSYGLVSNLVFGSNNTALTYLECQQSPISTIDTSLLSGLTDLILNDNQLTTIDVSQNSNLETLELDDNQLTTIDVESNLQLNTLKVEANQLQTAYLRNGNNNLLTTLRLQYNPELYCVFVDNANINYGNWYRGGAVTLVETEAECATASEVTLIPDVKFEQELISQGYDTSPSNGEIPTSKINSLTQLDVQSSDITDLTGIADFAALENLNCAYNNIDIIDVSNVSTLKSLSANYAGAEQVILGTNPNLTSISLTSNNLVSLDVSGLPALTGIGVGNNNLTTLDVTNNLALSALTVYGNPLTVLDLRNINIRTLNCTNTQIEYLDLSNSTNMNIFYIGNNPNLTYVNFKSGGNDDIDQIYSTTFPGLPNLETICVDDVNNLLALRIQALTDQDISITEDCLNQVTGTLQYDINNDGCDAADFKIKNLMIQSESVVDTTATFTSVEGEYVNYVSSNTYVTSLESSLPDYFTVVPQSQTTVFTDFNNTELVDFCIQANEIVDDLNVMLLPVNLARPGFDATYELIFSNIGTTQLDGSVALTFNDTMLSFISANDAIASQTTNSLTFDFTGLKPFESRTIELEFNVFTPPTVNSDDVLVFTSEILPVNSDITPEDNSYILEQVVVNSYDPNDKRVLQGSTIFEEEKGNYLDYIIRFQNTGTASVINVGIEDVLDAKLDWKTLQPLSSSHDYTVKVTNENKVEFIYENINLLAQSDDEELSQGYIAFRIKPKNDVVVGDIFEGEAAIYFDFNAPIITNTISTEIVAPLSVGQFSNQSVRLFPNPAQNVLHVVSNQIIDQLTIIDINGRVLNAVKPSDSIYYIDTSGLVNGVYFLDIQSGIDKSVKRFIKN